MPTLSGNNMKTISPVNVWNNGQSQQATVLSCQGNGDNLYNQASFTYTLFTQDESGYLQTSIANGYLTMTGEDYDGWSTNDYAYEWIAGQLNLTITGAYTPPDPAPTPTPPSPGTSGTSGMGGA
jgi:hypothetical protein